MTRSESAALIAATCMLGATWVEAADVVVLESTVARLPPGNIMGDSARIELAAGEALVVVTEDGRIVRLEGPYAGPAAGAAPDASAVRKAIERLVTADEPRVGGVGAVRGIDWSDAADTRPQPWFIHAEIDGQQCALRGRPLELWREEASRSVSAEVAAAGGGAAETVRWDEGSHRTAWPERLEPSDGGVYLIRFEAVERSTAIRLLWLPATVADSSLAATAWLAASDCTAQARLLLR
ncbi:MAG TPA: hypothetical protein VFX89_11815 [Gammaproteobacteria bacterium]|nr:hypothetical protein [Gammaproteobacteria bacterium]